MDEDSDSTDLSVSSEEGRPTILLAHYNFWFYVRTKLFSNAGCTKMPRNLTLFLYNCIFHHQTKEKFCFFEHFLGNFLRNYGKLFVKSRATCGKPQPPPPPPPLAYPSLKKICEVALLQTLSRLFHLVRFVKS